MTRPFEAMIVTSLQLAGSSKVRQLIHANTPSTVLTPMSAVWAIRTSIRGPCAVANCGERGHGSVHTPLFLLPYRPLPLCRHSEAVDPAILDVCCLLAA